MDPRVPPAPLDPAIPARAGVRTVRPAGAPLAGGLRDRRGRTPQGVPRPAGQGRAGANRCGAPGTGPEDRGGLGPARDRVAEAPRGAGDRSGRRGGAPGRDPRAPRRSGRKLRRSPAVRIAWWSPLPPMPSGISDYSFELLPLVARAADVDVVCSKVGPLWRRRAPATPAGLHAIDPRDFPARAASYDAVIYHLGNNPAHRFVYDEARHRPGIAVFHDFTMHHLIDWMHWGPPRRDLRGYRDALTREVGPELGERLATLHGTDVV